MLDREKRVEIYRLMYLSQVWELALLRLIDEGMAPSTYHPGRGSEGSEVGAVMALQPSDYLLYDHRGMAHIIAKGVPLDAIFGDFMGNSKGTLRGLGGGIVHVAYPDLGVLGQSGTLGGGQLIASGAALSAKLRGTDQVTMCFFGDGAANRGTFHEAANVAGAWNLPVIFVVQNNGWAVSTPTESVTGGRFQDRAHGYGFEGVWVDGRDAFAVYDVAAAAVNRARAGDGATLIEVKTTRMTGHYTADPQHYRSPDDRTAAEDADPIAFARAGLLEAGDISETELRELEASAAQEVKAAAEEAATGEPAGPDRIFEYLYV